MLLVSTLRTNPDGRVRSRYLGRPTKFSGLDTRNSTIENWNGTWTGYAIRKFFNTDVSIVDQNIRQEIPSIQIRFTEVALNYAEASMMLGQEAEAKKWINAVRFRVGMPAITETGAALMARYQNERNVEMFLEDQRFYDVRRWMTAPAALGRQAQIVIITGKTQTGQIRNDVQIQQGQLHVFVQGAGFGNG